MRQVGNKVAQLFRERSLFDSPTGPAEETAE